MTRFRPLSMLAIFLACAGSVSAIGATGGTPVAADRRWEDEIVYVVIQQKFFNGDTANDIMARRYQSHRDRYEDGYWGGDLEGVRQKLGDLADLGVTTIQLYPVVQNDKGAMGRFLPSGYRPRDYFRVDENFGNMTTLKRLIEEAHARGIHVLLDLPLGIPGFEHPYVTDPTKRDWFGAQTVYGLRRWKVEKPEVADYLIGVGKFWKEQTGCDGFRLDSAQLHPVEFRKRFNAELHGERPDEFILFAEIAENPRIIGRMMREAKFDSAYDFSLSRLRDVVGNDKSVHLLSFVAKEGQQFYPSPRSLVGLIDSYEGPTFIATAQEPKQSRMLAAMTYLLTLDRVPMLFTGDEIALAYQNVGEAFPRDRNKSEFLAKIKRLIAIRKAEPALRRGAWAQVKSEPPLYAFLRTLGDDRILVVLNSSKEKRTVTMPVVGRSWKSLRLEDLVAESTAKSADDDAPLKLEPFAVRILKVH